MDTTTITERQGAPLPNGGHCDDCRTIIADNGSSVSMAVAMCKAHKDESETRLRRSIASNPEIAAVHAMIGRGR